MGFWEDLGNSFMRLGIPEGTYKIYSKKSNSELIRLARNHDVNALKMLKLEVKDDEAIREMLQRGY